MRRSEWLRAHGARSMPSCPAEDLDSPLAAQWCPECDPDGPKSTRRSIAMEPRLWCPEADPEARLCDNCSRALQKPRQVHNTTPKRGGIDQ